MCCVFTLFGEWCVLQRCHGQVIASRLYMDKKYSIRVKSYVGVALAVLSSCVCAFKHPHMGEGLNASCWPCCHRESPAQAAEHCLGVGEHLRHPKLGCQKSGNQTTAVQLVALRKAVEYVQLHGSARPGMRRGTFQSPDQEEGHRRHENVRPEKVAF